MNRRNFLKSGLLWVPAFPAIVKAQSLDGPSAGVFNNNPATSRATPLFSDNFETPTTGYDSAGWTSGGTAVITPNSTATVLQGTQSLLIDCTGGKYGHADNSFTAGSTIWVFFRFQVPAAGQNNPILVMYVSQPTTTRVLGLVYLNTGSLQVSDGSGTHTANTVATVATGTTYLVWVRYTAGTGANAICSVGFSSTTTEPVSGNNFASLSNGDSTANAGSFSLFTDSVNVVYDTVRVYTADPGNNPP